MSKHYHELSENRYLQRILGVKVEANLEIGAICALIEVDVWNSLRMLRIIQTLAWYKKK